MCLCVTPSKIERETLGRFCCPIHWLISLQAIFIDNVKRKTTTSKRLHERKRKNVVYPSSSSFVLCIKRNLTLTQKKTLYFFLFFPPFLKKKWKYIEFFLWRSSWTKDKIHSLLVGCGKLRLYSLPVYTHFMSANDKRLNLFVFDLVGELGTKGEVMMVLVVWSYSLPIYDDLRRSDECFQRTRRELRGDGWLDFTSCGSCYYVFSWLLMWSQVLPCFVLAPFKSITWVLCVCNLKSGLHHDRHSWCTHTFSLNLFILSPFFILFFNNRTFLTRLNISHYL